MNCMHLVQTVLIVIFALPICVEDVRSHLIRNSHLKMMLIACFGLHLYFLSTKTERLNLLTLLLASASVLLLLVLLNHLFGDVMGYGDIKLLSLLFLILALTKVEDFILWISLIWLWGGLHCIAVYLRHRSIRRLIAFAPSIFLGTLTYLATRLTPLLPQ